MRLIAYAVGSLLLLLLLFGVPFATYELIEDRALEGNAVIVTATAGTAVATVVLAVLTTISARAAAKAAAMSAEALAYSTQPLIVPIPEELPGDYNVPEVGRNYILRFPFRNVGNGAAILERVDPPGGERFRTPDRTHLPQVTVQPGEVTRLWFEWRADADEIRPDWDFGDNT